MSYVSSRRSSLSILKSCWALNGDVVAFVAQAQARADSTGPPAEDSEEASGTNESEDGNGRNRKLVVNSREDLVEFASDVLKTNINGFNVTW